MDEEQKQPQGETRAATGQETPGEAAKGAEGRDWEREAREARKEAQSLRARLREGEEAEKKRAEAEMSELEKATKRAGELEARLADTERRAQDAEIRAIAAAKGFADPKDALALLDRSALDADLGNAGDLLDGLLKAKPYLRKGGSAPAGGGNPSGAAKATTDAAKRDAAVAAFPILRNRLGS